MSVTRCAWNRVLTDNSRSYCHHAVMLSFVSLCLVLLLTELCCAQTAEVTNRTEVCKSFESSQEAGRKMQIVSMSNELILEDSKI